MVGLNSSVGTATARPGWVGLGTNLLLMGACGAALDPAADHPARHVQVIAHRGDGTAAPAHSLPATEDRPWRRTMFTGVGHRFPKEVHLMTTRLTGRAVAGGLVDGPVYQRIFETLRGVSLSGPDVLAAFQDGRAVYHDDWQDYASNEPTMDGTASAILMWAVLELQGRQ